MYLKRKKEEKYNTLTVFCLFLSFKTDPDFFLWQKVSFSKYNKCSVPLLKSHKCQELIDLQNCFNIYIDIYLKEVSMERKMRVRSRQKKIIYIQFSYT